MLADYLVKHRVLRREPDVAARLRARRRSFDALVRLGRPHPDAVLISHTHYDHLDVPTVKRLKKAFPKVRMVTSLGNRTVLEPAGLEGAVELHCWQSVAPPGVKVTAVPAQHFSNRGLTDRDVTLWTGFVIQGAAGATYFGGDTGYGTHLAEAREWLGPMRAALLPIGAFGPSGS